jgi:hypothetical protein
VVGVVSLLGLAWLGLSENALGLRNSAGLLSAAQAERTEEPIACPSVSPAEGQSSEVTVLAFASLRPTLP